MKLGQKFKLDLNGDDDNNEVQKYGKSAITKTVKEYKQPFQVPQTKEQPIQHLKNKV